MDDSNILEYIKLSGATGVGALIVGLFTKFTFRKFAEEETATNSAEGKTDIIELLRQEVDRLAAVNESLSTKLAELQNQIITLRMENAELKAEIQQLNLQIKSLKS